MKMKFSAALILLIISTAIYGQEPAKPAADSGKAKGETVAADKLTAKDYEDLLAKLKGGDTGIDFRKLRLAFVETKDFAPYGGRESRVAMNKALEKQAYSDALKAAEDRLKIDYVDIDAHYTAFVANRELGKPEQADYHRLVALGLLNSILENADGKTAKTAFFVVSISEEYFIMSFKGYRTTSQSLKNEDGHVFDVLSGTDPKTNETVEFFFNIDKVFGKF